MALNQKTKNADSESVLACRLAMAEAALGELQNRVASIQELASLSLEGDETGALTVAIIHLAGAAGICIDLYEEDTGSLREKDDVNEWFFYPSYLESRSEYKKAVAQVGGAS